MSADKSISHLKGMPSQQSTQAFVERFEDLRTWQFLLVAFSAFLGIYWDFFIGERRYIYMDAGADDFQAYWPILSHAADIVRHFDGSFYTPQSGIGTSLFSIGYIVFDPFNWPLFVLGKELIAPAMIYIMLAKTFLAGYFFYLYLKKLGASRYSCQLGALLYSFCGYMTVWGQHYMFATAIVLAALALFAFESALVDNNWRLLPIAVALFAACSFYFFFMFALYFTIYSTSRIAFSSPSFDSRWFGTTLAKLAGSSLLGLALSAAVLLPTVGLMLDSPRVNPGADFGNVLTLFSASFWISVTSRLFSPTGVFTTGRLVDGSLNWDGSLYESPHVYIGIISLIVLPQFFRIRQRQYLVPFAIISVFCIVVVSTPAGAYFMNGLSTVTNRASFIWALCGIPMVAIAIDHVGRQRVNLKILLISVGALLIALYSSTVRAEKTHRFADAYTQLQDLRTAIVASLIVVLGILVAFLGKNPKSVWVHRAVPLFVAIELAYSSWIGVNSRHTINADSGYEEARNRFIQELELIVHGLESTPEDFFRIESDFAFTWSPNDPFIVRGFRSTSSYLSLQQPSYLKLRNAFQLADPWSSSLYNIPKERHFLKSLLGVKYYLAVKQGTAPIYFKYIRKHSKPIPLVSTDDIDSGAFNTHLTNSVVHIYENTAALPLAFGYDSYIDESDFSALENPVKDRAVLAGVVVSPRDAVIVGGLKRLSMVDLQALSDSDALAEVEERRQTAVRMRESSSGHWSGSVSSNSDFVLCFSLPFEKGWELLIDGRATKVHRVNEGLLGARVPEGTHTVELTHRHPLARVGLTVSLGAAIVAVFLRYRARRQPNTHQTAIAV